MSDEHYQRSVVTRETDPYTRMREGYDPGLRMAACLRGEHERHEHYLGTRDGMVLHYDKQPGPLSVPVSVCKHCRSLYVPRGQGEPTP